MPIYPVCLFARHSIRVQRCEHLIHTFDIAAAGSFYFGSTGDIETCPIVICGSGSGTLVSAEFLGLIMSNRPPGLLGSQDGRERVATQTGLGLTLL